MFLFGKESLENLSNLDARLQKVCYVAIKRIDFKVVRTIRGKIAQMLAFKSGGSLAKFGLSPHNFYPSFAFDFIPYVNGKPCETVQADNAVAEVLHEEAAKLGIDIVWGCDRDWLIITKNFRDYGHIQIRNWPANNKRPLVK